MSEVGIPVEQEINPEWAETLDKIEDGIDFLLAPEYYFDHPVDIDPYTYSEGQDERIFPELGSSEQGQVLERVYDSLGIRPEEIYVEDEYEVQANEGFGWEGLAKVEVISTARFEDDIFLHRRTSEDGVTDYYIAPKDYRPE